MKSLKVSCEGQIYLCEAREDSFESAKNFLKSRKDFCEPIFKEISDYDKPCKAHKIHCTKMLKRG